MDAILPKLMESLTGDVRPMVRDRFAALVRELDYLRKTDNPQLLLVRRGGWTIKMLEVVMALNSFYQVVLAPLASSGRAYQNRKLGSAVPLTYGESMRFDRAWGEQITSAYSAFKDMIAALDIQESYLTAQRTEDVLFRLNRDLRADE